jgi:hypothetical protein
MKKYVLVENQITKLDTFKHFHDLINLQINDANVGGLGFDDIKPYPQQTNLFKHNKFNAPFYLELDNNQTTINSWNGNRISVPVDTLTDKLHHKNTNRNWIAACWINPTANNDLKDIRYIYRKSSDMQIYDMLTDEPINNGKTFITNTVFLIHGEWPKVPLYHILLNDNVVFWSGQTIDNENFFVDTVSYHDGNFNEYIFKPKTSGCFIQDNLLITPRKTFKIDFYGRSRFGLQNRDFPFELLDLKVRSNLHFVKKDIGVYEFDMQDSQVGYLYARINAGYGAEVEQSTQMRLALTVHRSR